MQITRLDVVMDKVINKEGYRFVYFDREIQAYKCISPATDIDGRGSTPDEAENVLKKYLIDIKLGSRNKPVQLLAKRITVTERRGLLASNLLSQIAALWNVQPSEAVERLIFLMYCELNQFERDINNLDPFELPNHPASLNTDS
jgi:hypothetical protein